MKNNPLRLFTLSLFVLFLAACAGTLDKNYGSFRPDNAVGQAFATFQVDPNLQYYISGSNVEPNAIMGLRKNYTLAESLWQKVDMTPAVLKKLVEGMKQRASEGGEMSLWGFSMRDPMGREVGVWYSVLFAPTYIRVVGDNVISIGRPAQHTYREEGDEEKDRR